MAAPSRMPRQLRKSWLHGKVALKIRWGTPGDFKRCVRQAHHYGIPPSQANGMCATLHHKATGMWPGDKRNLAGKGVKH